MESDPDGSSGHMSARSSLISTNSNARSFLTTLGGSVADGLYGPALCSDQRSAVLSSAAAGVEGPASAAAARTSRPEEISPLLLGVNVGTALSVCGSGTPPRAGGAMPCRKWGKRASVRAAGMPGSGQEWPNVGGAVPAPDYCMCARALETPRVHACFSPDINVKLEHYGESVTPTRNSDIRVPVFSSTFTELLSPTTGRAMRDCNVTKYGNTSLTLTKVPRSDFKHLKQLRMHKVRHSHRQLRRRRWFFGT